MRLVGNRRTSCLAAIAAAAFSAIGTPLASADLMVLNFSGTYTDATVLRPSFDFVGFPGDLIPGGSNRPTVPAGLIGSSFSGSFYFDPDAMTATTNGVNSVYAGITPGVATNSYTLADQQAPTQSSLTFNVLGDQLSNRRADTSTNTVQVRNLGTLGSINQNFYNGFDFGDRLEGPGQAPIIPMQLLGVDPSAQVENFDGYIAEDGSTVLPPRNDVLTDGPAFYYANQLNIAFHSPNPLATGLALPTAGPIDLSQFSLATLSFVTQDNVIQYDYQDFITVTGTITSASISAVPEPSTGMQTGVILGLALLGFACIGRRRADRAAAPSPI